MKPRSFTLCQLPHHERNTDLTRDLQEIDTDSKLPMLDAKKNVPYSYKF